MTYAGRLGRYAPQMLEVTRTYAFAVAVGLLLGAATVGAQGSPFDLDRGPAGPPATTSPAPAAPTQSSAPAPASPFDLRRGPAAAVPDSAASATSAAAPGDEALPRSRFDALLCAGLLILFAVSFVVQGGTLRRMWQSAFNANLLTRLQREQRKAGAYWWAFLGAVVLGAFAYVAVRQLWPGTAAETWRVLDLFVLAALAATAARLLVLAVLGWAFPLGKPVGAYRTLVLVWAGVLGVVLFPALVLACFAPPGVAAGVCYLGLGATAVAYVWRGLRATAAAGRYVTGHPAHFMLYFCALEMSPLAIGYAWLSS